MLVSKCIKYIGHVKKKININIIFTAVIYADFYGFSDDERDARGIQQYRD